MAEVDLPPGAAYVPLQSYNSVKSNLQKLDRCTVDYVASIQKTPYITAMSIPNETDRINAYDITRNSLLQAVSWTQTTIPT